MTLGAGLSAFSMEPPKLARDRSGRRLCAYCHTYTRGDECRHCGAPHDFDPPVMSLYVQGAWRAFPVPGKARRRP